MPLRYCISEKEGLAYRLVAGEDRHEMLRDGAWVHWSFAHHRGQQVKGTIVLLHGVASNGSRWEEFIDSSELREDYDMIRLDLRGHAASVCSRKVGLEDWCADIEAILNEAKVPQAIVIGHSLGAQVAMHFGAHYPSRVSALVLLDPLVSEALTEKALSMRRKLPMLRVAEAVTRTMNRLGFVRRMKPQDLRAKDAQAREKLARGGEELAAFIEEYSSTRSDLQHTHLAPYLRDLQEVGRQSPKPECLQCPTLVIGASSGTFTDATRMRQWVNRLPHGQMAVVTCAHWPMTECPQEVARSIELFIRSTHFLMKSEH